VNAIQFIGGAAAGCVAVWAGVWLAFVYPYGEGVSLRWLWWGLLAGLGLGVVSVLGVTYLMAFAWPRD
jgi:hypothetical protein